MGRFLSSSLGRKFVMGLTGFMLLGFLVFHLLGNLTLYGADDGSTFTAYADKLHSLGPLMYVAEVALVLLFGIHIWMAFALTKQNRDARPDAYVVKKTIGESTVASRNMFITGSIVLGFLIVHIINFRFAGGITPLHSDDLYKRVVDVLSNPIYAAIYVAGMVALGFHLCHGFRSAFQSLGANHPRLNVAAKRIGIVIAVVIAVGFASFPIMALVKGGAQ